MSSRSEILLEPVRRGARVIEIGPSFSPIAPKSEGWNAYSIDHLDKAGLVKKYTGHPGVDVTRIEAVDYVWQGGPLSDAVPSASHGTFDAFIASHVIEHVPDLVAFLESAATLLKSTGVVVLAVPDKRYCFDFFQSITTTGAVLAAHREKRSRHTAALGYDHFAYAAQNGGAGVWGQHPSMGITLSHSLDEAWTTSAAMGADGEYVDLHAWHFTPSSFELMLLELARFGVTDWQIDRTTDATGCEFYAWLRRGGKATAAKIPEAVLTERRLTLLKRIMLENRAQIDWLLAGEPELVTGPIGLLPIVPNTEHERAVPPVHATSEVGAARYVDWLPVAENAARAFEGEWSSAVPGLAGTGHANLFDDDRIKWFEERSGGFAGKKVLELGPLEGGHTYMMTQRGATVLAIESNVQAWMRCLVVKDTLNIKGAQFLLGDFVRYLSESPPRVDFVLASGVLYHMTDPVKVLNDLCRVGDSIGIWTHYFDATVLRSNDSTRAKFSFEPRIMITQHGRSVQLYDQRYLQALEWKGFCGGAAHGSSWLRKEDIVGMLEDEGFECEVYFDHTDHQNGPACCIFARRRITGDAQSG